MSVPASSTATGSYCPEVPRARYRPQGRAPTRPVTCHLKTSWPDGFGGPLGLIDSTPSMILIRGLQLSTFQLSLRRLCSPKSRNHPACPSKGAYVEPKSGPVQAPETDLEAIVWVTRYVGYVQGCGGRETEAGVSNVRGRRIPALSASMMISGLTTRVSAGGMMKHRLRSVARTGAGTRASTRRQARDRRGARAALTPAPAPALAPPLTAAAPPPPRRASCRRPRPPRPPMVCILAASVTCVRAAGCDSSRQYVERRATSPLRFACLA